MDATSSFQVLLVVAGIVALLLGLIRLLGTLAAAALPDLPRPATPPRKAESGPLLAILAAAVAEELETEDFRIESVSEVPTDHAHLGWPRIGKFQRHKPSQGLRF